MVDEIFRIASDALSAVDDQTKLMFDRVANTNTPGYKKSQAVVTSNPIFESALQRAIGMAENRSETPIISKIYNDYSQGAYQKTGSPTHVAIGDDKGFFVLQGPQGEVFTRDGRFWVDPNGRMLSVSGNLPVIGHNGPIVVLPGAKIGIEANGVIKVDNNESDRIFIAQFETADRQQLQSINNVMFRVPNNAAFSYLEDANPRLLQGFVESSNAGMIEETMNMVKLSRIQGLDAKLVQNRDAMMSKALEMGRPTQ